MIVSHAPPSFHLSFRSRGARVFRSHPGPAAAPPLRLKLGCQSAPTDEAHIRYLARYGVQGVCGFPRVPPDRLYATAEELSAMREMVERNHLTLDMVAPPFLASISVDRDSHAAIMLGQSPERDRDIEQLQTLIRNCAAAGIPAIKYNLCIVGDLRTARVPGRGDCTYAAWRLREAHLPALTRAGRVDADADWERVTYFLNRIIPVAGEYKVRMALHPNDPYVPDGFKAWTACSVRWKASRNSSPFRRALTTASTSARAPSSEMLEDPGSEIFDVIRYFGSRDRKSSMCISATSAAGAAISSKSIPTKATSISSRLSRSTARSATPT